MQPDFVLLHPPSVYDFRKMKLSHEPIASIIPSTPNFEFYPIGFISIANYLEKNGYRVRIVNIANKMLLDSKFNVLNFIKKLEPICFGIDLHWLPSAHGAISLARLLKEIHPDKPVIFGGLSATYYEKEIMERYNEVDFIVKGDSTEKPLLSLISKIEKNSKIENIENLTYREGNRIKSSPITYVPDELEFEIDYSYLIRSVFRYRDFAGYLPYKNWSKTALTAVLTVKGCTEYCSYCGGSCFSYNNVYNRNKPAYRKPEFLVDDMRKIREYIRGPIFIIGDIFQKNEKHGYEILDWIEKERIDGTIVFEFFKPVNKEKMEKINSATENFCIQLTPDTHELGNKFTNGIEGTIENAFDASCERIDVFYTIGLPNQTIESVRKTAQYCELLLKKFENTKPFISPLAPFIDPGSLIFERSEKFGYKFFARSLEEHIALLLQPEWECMLNYETNTLKRNDIVRLTYESIALLNEIKAKYGSNEKDEKEELLWKPKFPKFRYLKILRNFLRYM